MKEKLQKYAQLIIKKGINLQKNQPVVISAPVECLEFVHVLAKQAYIDGAKSVEVKWSDPVLTRLQFDYEPLENFKNEAKHKIMKTENQVDQNYAHIKITGISSKEFEGINQEKLITNQQTINKFHKKKDNAIMNDHVSWCVVAAPTINWAQEVYPDEKDAVNKLWDAIFKMTYVDQENPIKYWDEHIARLNHVAKKINDLDLSTLHFKSDYTDLEVGLVKDYRFLSASSQNQVLKNFFCANLPTEEVYSAPNKYAVNGYVKATKPLNYQGQLIEDFYFKFKDGEVVDYDAKIGKSALDGLLSVDAGARRLGEVALVSVSSPINQLNTIFYNTLFDENASCHLALGKAYPTCVRPNDHLEEIVDTELNDSAIHVDFMFGDNSMDVYGKTKNGEEILLFSQGEFVI